MKTLVKILLTVLVLGGLYSLYSISYLNWDTEKKSEYQFNLIQRELRQHPEKLNKVYVVIKETNTSERDTLSPEEITKLTPYPKNFFVQISVPMSDQLGEYMYLVRKFEGDKVSAFYLEKKDGKFTPVKVFPESSTVEKIQKENLTMVKLTKAIIKHI